MTAYRCWVDFPTDKSLQSRVKKGEFGESLPLASFPPASSSCWPALLAEWCRDRGLSPIEKGLEISVKVKKAQLQDFLEFAYDNDPSYSDPAKMLMWKGCAYLAHRLTDLRAFVAQQLNPNLWYTLNADEF